MLPGPCPPLEPPSKRLTRRAAAAPALRCAALPTPSAARSPSASNDFPPLRTRTSRATAFQTIALPLTSLHTVLTHSLLQSPEELGPGASSVTTSHLRCDPHPILHYARLSRFEFSLPSCLPDRHPCRPTAPALIRRAFLPAPSVLPTTMRLIAVVTTKCLAFTQPACC